MAAAHAVKKQTEAIHQNKARTVAGLVVLRFGMRCSWMGAVMPPPPHGTRWPVGSAESKHQPRRGLRGWMGMAG
jgi:hypothetical protein